MPLAHETVVFDVHDCKVYALLTDAVGASPTYGAAVDIPGINHVEVDPNLIHAELKGDARIIAKKGRTDRINFKAAYGKIALDALAVLLGGTVSDSGTTPNQIARMRLKSPAPLPYFKVEFKIEDLDSGLGDLHVAVYKCQLTGGTLLGTSTDNFGQPSFDAEGIAIQGTIGSDVGVMADWTLYESVTSLSA